MKTQHKLFTTVIALALVAIAPARAWESQSKSAQNSVSPSDARDLVRQADALMAQATQIGERADMIQRVKGGAMAAGGSSNSDDPNIAPKLNGGDLGSAIAKYKQMQTDRWTQAEKLYRQALDANPENAAWHVKLADVAADLGHKDQEIAEVRKACDLEPQNAEWAADLGNIYYDRKNYGEAEATYRKSIAIAPQNAAYHFDLACVLWAEKQWPEAESESKQAVTLDPANAMYQQTAEDIANRKPFKH